MIEYVKNSLQSFVVETLNNASWLSRPLEVDRNRIKILLKNNQWSVRLETTKILRISKTNIGNHLHQLFILMYDLLSHIWIFIFFKKKIWQW